MRNDHKLSSEFIKIQKFDVNIVNMNLPGLNLRESEQALEEAGLARARPPDHPHLLLGLGLEVDSPEGGVEARLVSHDLDGAG